MHTKTITELSKQLGNKEISSVELTQHYIDRIEKIDGKLNSFITVCKDTALTEAKAADEKRARDEDPGEKQPLLGIPIAQKDIFCSKDIRTSCGSKMLDNFISPYDATVVEKFKQAGSVLIGKTNMDEFAMGSSSETSFYGPVKNPWDTERVPGGSSGGSAAAVAAGLSPGATGTDTGGSIRQPAALCGITGLKPTYGRVSRFGMIAFASSLDQGGAFAKSAQDAALMLKVMAGYDPKDSTCVNKPVPNYLATLTNKVKGLKIGLPKEFFSKELDNSIAKCTEESIDVFKKLGVKFKEISLPNSPLSIPAYYVVAPAECSSNLARYDGVRFGYRCDNPKNLEDLYKRTRAEGFGDEVKRRIMIGTYVLSAGYYDAYYLKAQKIRQLISDDFQKAFSVVDMILAPTSPTLAFKIGEKVDNPVSMYLSDIYTIAVNLAGLPGISIPSGFVDNLPVGLQLIGDYFAEEKILQAAHQFQLNTDWHKQLPNIKE